MAAKRVNVSYFVEDDAHEYFVVAVTEQVATQEQVSLAFGSRTTCRGSSVIVKVRDFLRDRQSGPSLPTDLLIIAVDGNCKGHQEKRRELQKELQQSGFPGPVVYMIPDPHIERWYLCDPQALRRTLSDTLRSPKLPQKKCERDWYKNHYQNIIRESQVQIVLSPYEHAEAIVKAMDLQKAARIEPALKTFLDDLRTALRSFTRERL